MRAAFVLVALSACGRIGFDAGSDDINPTDAARVDAPPGAPFLVELPLPSAITDLAEIPDGGLAVVGARIGSLTIDGVTDPGVGAIDAVVLALDSDGGVRWLHQYGGTENDYAATVATAPDGTIYVGGFAEGNSTFGGVMRTNQRTDAFLASYTTDGVYRWSTGFGGVEDSADHSDMVMGLAVAPDGDIVVVGRVAGIVDFGGGSTSPSSPISDAFVARYSSAGTFRWARRFGSGNDNGITGVAVANDAIYLSGYYTGTPDFGTGTLPERGSNDAFLMRLTGTGTTVEWVSTFGGPDNQRIYGVTIAGGVLVGAGYYWESVDLPPVWGIPASRGRSDALVVAYNLLDGSLAWATSFGGPGCDYLYSSHLANSSQVIISGAFQDTVNLGLGPLSATGLSDSIVFAIDTNAAVWTDTLGDATDELANASAGSRETALYLGGTRNLRHDQGCYAVEGETTGYIHRF